jgi:hypothetical protein
VKRVTLAGQALSVHFLPMEEANNDTARRRARGASREIRLLSTSAIPGYLFPEASLRAGMERRPQGVRVDGCRMLIFRFESETVQ